MYEIKKQAEDFKVEELLTPEFFHGIKSELDTTKNPKDTFSIVKLTKKNHSLIKVVQLIARNLKIKEKQIGYAGIKDKHAITVQYLSLPVKKERIQKIKLEHIEIEYLGRSDEPLYLGALIGNAFEIVVRNIEEKNKENIEHNLKLFKKNPRLLNLYGEQRFASHNAEVGKLLLQKKFKEAADGIMNDANIHKNEIQEYLGLNPTDIVNALKIIPKKHLVFYIHAYQSLLWNTVARDLYNIQKSKEDLPKKLPLVGFGTEFENKEIEEYFTKLLKEDGLNPRSFIIRPLPEISSEGDMRDVFVDVSGFEYSWGDDETNEGMRKCTLSFNLPKGAYATELINQLFSN